MEETDAKALMQILLDASASLNQVAQRIEQISNQEELQQYRRGVAGLMVALYTDLMRPIIREHPGLDPDAANPAAVVAFWREAGSKKWFAKDDGFDASCVARFRGLWDEGAAGRLASWEAAPETALALVLLLDQMPRNMFRGTPKVYASDPQARGVAARAIAKGHDHAVEMELRPFFYLPFSHSEDMADQERALVLYATLDDAEQMKWARHHHGIVARFGRFPHRNAILGRASTPAEAEWLAQEGSFKG